MTGRHGFERRLDRLRGAYTHIIKVYVIIDRCVAVRRVHSRDTVMVHKQRADMFTQDNKGFRFQHIASLHDVYALQGNRNGEE